MARHLQEPDAASAAADVAQICAELAEDAEEYLRLETARIAILAFADRADHLHHKR